MTNVGGFFASLSLKADKNSFNEGMGLLKNLGKGFDLGLITKGIAALAGLATAAVAGAAESSRMAQGQVELARNLGMSVVKLNDWQNAVKMLGISNPEGFTQGMLKITEAFRNIKLGEIDDSFFKALALVNGFSGDKNKDMKKVLELDTDQLTTLLWTVLPKMPDQKAAQGLAQKLGGEAWVNALSFGGPVKNLQEARSASSTTQSGYNVGVEFNQEMSKISVKLGEDFKTIGLEISSKLLPYLKLFSRWLSDNQSSIVSFGEVVGSIVGLIGDLAVGISGVISSIGGQFADWQKKQAYLEERKLSGWAKATVMSDLTYSTGPEQDLYEQYKKGKLSIEQINKIDASKERLALFKMGKIDEAVNLPDKAVSPIKNWGEALAGSVKAGNVSVPEANKISESKERTFLFNAGKVNEAAKYTDKDIATIKARGDTLYSALNPSRGSTGLQPSAAFGAASNEPGIQKEILKNHHITVDVTGLTTAQAINKYTEAINKVLRA
jgi:hypothetical protein